MIIIIYDKFNIYDDKKAYLHFTTHADMPITPYEIKNIKLEAGEKILTA